jgi:hypothetical protein
MLDTKKRSKETPESALTAACAHAVQLLSDRAKIAAELIAAQAPIEAASEDEGRLLADLGDESKDAKLVHKNLALTRQTIETLNARRAGLHEKLRLNLDQLGDARSSLTAARAEAGAQRMDLLLKKLIGATDTLRSVMREVLAEDAGFNDGLSHIPGWLASATFPDPKTGLNLLTTHVAMGGQVGPAWAGDDKLTALATPEHQRIAKQLARELAAAGGVSRSATAAAMPISEAQSAAAEEARRIGDSARQAEAAWQAR